MRLHKVKRALALAILLVCAIYLGDYVSAKYQIPGSRKALDSVEVQRDFAVHDNDKSIEYTAPSIVEEACVVSLFPHFGNPPCWYLRRHTQQHVELNGGQPAPFINFP